MQEQLQTIGFTEKEALIYELLAKYPHSTANALSKLSHTNRTVTYNILKQLQDKGVVDYKIVDKKQNFTITNPKNIIHLIKEKEIIAKELVQQVQEITKNHIEHQEVEVLRGKEGVKIIFHELKKAKPLLVYNATGLVYEHLKFSAPHIVKQLQLNKSKTIASPMAKKTAFTKEVKNIKYFPKEVNNYATTFIYDDTVVIFNIKEDPFIVKIKSRLIAQGYKQNFEFMWKML